MLTRAANSHAARPLWVKIATLFAVLMLAGQRHGLLEALGPIGTW